MKKIGFFLLVLTCLLSPYVYYQLRRPQVEQRSFCLAVRRPPDVVAQYLEDPEKMKLWMGGLVEVEPLAGHQPGRKACYELVVANMVAEMRVNWVLKNSRGVRALAGDFSSEDFDLTFTC